MKKNVHFKALINYYDSERGGLVSPISSGFRSTLTFPLESKSYLGIQTFSDDELIFPGDSATVDITLINAEPFLEKLYEGMDFELSNNSQTIGYGVITGILF
ncbi:hypothetical protein SAMN05421664_1989 [Chryseobacterium soldanellicola]|uniref:Elongation factor Tu n=1 Tax=Chryseobacterium soldanellicola TaxID=311333 RepID=A0A1H1CJK7_9FLAO|nr:hypothetical protein [Chryseobacterium soldanellicola]SDQ64323.1 hypothetical protein SAMN05421664_1989 [Chryseobacterium soldanellicola]